MLKGTFIRQQFGHTQTKKLTPKQCKNKDYDNAKSKINDHETDGYSLK